jgi:hypothetical protein
MICCLFSLCDSVCVHAASSVVGNVRILERCGGASHVLSMSGKDGKRKESALFGGEEEGERGDLGDGGGHSFPFAGYGGTGDGVYTGGGTNNTFICPPESAELSRPTSIAACRSLV